MSGPDITLLLDRVLPLILTNYNLTPKGYSDLQVQNRLNHRDVEISYSKEPALRSVLTPREAWLK